MNNYLTLFDLIGALARRRYQAAERNFAALGLNHTEARLLTLTHQADGAATQDELSTQILIDRSNVGRALKRLEQAGYIVRRKDFADKRANLVRLTAQGRRAVGEIAKRREPIARSLFTGLSEQEAGEAARLLNKVFADGEEKLR